MISFSGTHITRDFGAPNIRDMAVAGMRLVRFAGAGCEVPFWPVGMHSLFVADILMEILGRPDLEHEGLLHDLIGEAVVNDIPKPHKTAEQREHEHRIAARTRALLGLNPLSEVDEFIVKQADIMAVHAEGALGCGPRGYEFTQTGFKKNGSVMAILHSKYISNTLFVFDELLLADGHWPIYFEDRLRTALRRHQKIESIRA